MKKNNNPPMEAAELRRRAEKMLKNRKGSQRSEEEVTRAAEDMQVLVQELQIHQIELEMQNEELRQTRAQMETLLSQYTDLYDFAPMGYFTLDRTGAIRRVNLTGSQLLGEERARLLKRRFGFFVSEADRHAFSDFLKKVFSKQVAVSDKTACEVTLRGEGVRPPTSETHRQAGPGGAGLQVHIEAQATEDGQECLTVMMDITRRRQAEAALLESHARFERNLQGAINVISETIERKGSYPPGHHRRVVALASAIAREMGLTDFQMQGIELAAAVYDIGLMDIPIEFLQDTNHLEGIQRTIYRGYPKTGHDTLKKIEFPWPIAEIILQHRECFDGSGFPQGLKGRTSSSRPGSWPWPMPWKI